MKAVLKNMAVFFSGAILARSCGMVQAFLIAKSFGPADYGVWVTLLIAVSYFPIIGLGVVEALTKMVPQFVGRGETKNAREIESAVLGFTVIVVCLEIALLPVLRHLAPALGLESNQAWLVYPLIIAVGIGHFTGLFYNRLAAYEHFKGAASVDFIRAVSSLIFVGVFGWIWRIKGAVVGYVLQEALACAAAVFLSTRFHGRVGLAFRWKIIGNAIRIGLPITLIWWIIVVKGSVDRILLGMFFGRVDVGYYGLGISIINILALMPTVVSRVLYPKVNKRVGAAADLETMRKIVLMPTMALGLVFANVQALVLMLLPVVYTLILPKYRPGLPAAEALVLGAFFTGLLGNGANFLIATNRERTFLKDVVITLIVTVILDTALIKIGFGIAGVAVGTTIAGLGLCTVVWRNALIALEIRHIWRTILTLYAPLIILGFAVAAVQLLGWRSLEKVDASSIAVYLGLFLILNGTIALLPAYRQEARLLSRSASPPKWLRRGIDICFGT